MLYSFDYEQIAWTYDVENVIIFIDVLQQLMNYYIKVVIDPKKLYDFFIIAKGLVLLVIPNNYVYGMMFREYIVNISEYDGKTRTTAVRIQITPKDNYCYVISVDIITC
jgi:hypothetical protein